MISDNIMVAHELIHSLKSRKQVSQTYMVIKTDMSKAYDQVEWDFLEKAMKAFGFSEIWISWIMATIRMVNYSVLINGNPKGHITPQRGLQLRRPYPFFLKDN